MVKLDDVEIQVKGVYPSEPQEPPHYDIEFIIRVHGQHEFDVAITTDAGGGLLDQALFDALGALVNIGRGITERASDMKGELKSKSPGLQRTYIPKVDG